MQHVVRFTIAQLVIVCGSFLIPPCTRCGGFEQDPGIYLRCVIVMLLSLSLLNLYVLSRTLKNVHGDGYPCLSLGSFVLRASLSWFCGTVLFHLLAIMFGAPIFELVVQTALFGGILSSVTVLPVATLAYPIPIMDCFRNVFISRSRRPVDVCVFYPTLGACLGAHLGAILIPYDWDRPWQAWPLTCVFGGLLGYSLGLCLSLFEVFIKRWGARGSSTCLSGSPPWVNKRVLDDGEEGLIMERRKIR